MQEENTQRLKRRPVFRGRIHNMRRQKERARLKDGVADKNAHQTDDRRKVESVEFRSLPIN